MSNFKFFFSITNTILLIIILSFNIQNRRQNNTKSANNTKTDSVISNPRSPINDKKIEYIKDTVSIKVLSLDSIYVNFFISYDFITHDKKQNTDSISNRIYGVIHDNLNSIKYNSFDMLNQSKLQLYFNTALSNASIELRKYHIEIKNIKIVDLDKSMEILLIAYIKDNKLEDEVNELLKY